MENSGATGIKSFAALFATVQRPLSIALRDRISRSTDHENLQQRIEALFVTGSPGLLWYLQPYELADDWYLDRHMVLEHFVRGAGNGLYDLHWIHHCPGCNGAAGRHEQIAAVPDEGNCKICDLDFVNYLDETVEVSFSASQQLVEYPPDMLDQFRKEMVQEIRTKGSFDASSAKVTGQDCLSIPVFREVYGDDVLSGDQSLHLRHLPILFTDIRSSTEMYQKYGDVRAYKAVRQHFDILFGAVERNGGAVVKTIGDAVMATFVRNHDALTATLEAMKEFPFSDPSDDFHLDVKMGVHSGPCIAVTLNGQIDYFGSTVNMAARIQGLAEGGQVVISEDMLTCDHCKNTIRGFVDKVVHKKVSLRGIDEPVSVYKINLPRNGKGI